MKGSNCSGSGRICIERPFLQEQLDPVDPAECRDRLARHLSRELVPVVGGADLAIPLRVLSAHGVKLGNRVEQVEAAAVIPPADIIGHKEQDFLIAVAIQVVTGFESSAVQ